MASEELRVIYTAHYDSLRGQVAANMLGWLRYNAGEAGVASERMTLDTPQELMDHILDQLYGTHEAPATAQFAVMTPNIENILTLPNAGGPAGNEADTKKPKTTKAKKGDSSMSPAAPPPPGKGPATTGPVTTPPPATTAAPPPPGKGPAVVNTPPPAPAPAASAPQTMSAVVTTDPVLSKLVEQVGTLAKQNAELTTKIDNMAAGLESLARICMDTMSLAFHLAKEGVGEIPAIAIENGQWAPTTKKGGFYPGALTLENVFTYFPRLDAPPDGGQGNG